MVGRHSHHHWPQTAELLTLNERPQGSPFLVKLLPPRVATSPTYSQASEQHRYPNSPSHSSFSRTPTPNLPPAHSSPTHNNTALRPQFALRIRIPPHPLQPPISTPHPPHASGMSTNHNSSTALPAQLVLKASVHCECFRERLFVSVSIKASNNHTQGTHLML